MTASLLHGLIMVGYLGSAVSYIRHFPTRQFRIGRYATGLLLISLICHSVLLISIGIQSGHLPFVGLYESISFFTWLIAIVYLSLELKFRDKSLGAFVVPLILTAQIAASMLIHPGSPLPPLLQSSWFSIHVTASFVAYAAFFFSFITGILYMMQTYYLKARRFGVVFSRLPALDMLDDMNLKATTIGWLFLTLGMATGLFWALQAWPTFLWLQDPKIVCVILTWVIYAFQLTARYTLGWQGQRTAYLATAGFISVLFAYIGARLWTDVHVF
ncbi:MAG: cytochrome c biogenesis protein CcsA [Candidatus Latescibacteria bacterium]|nr:cytochrome c biogenesis protein CcsA [Candidatus Latescibacterota bacterium]